MSLPAANDLLRVEGLSVNFGETRVIDDLSFSVRAGRTTAIVGESGSGKSVTSMSIMRLADMAGASYPQGRILFCREQSQVDLLAADQKAIRLEAEKLLPALLHLNFHGYPAHEWTRPLSGYVPRGFEVWTIPKGFFLIMRHGEGWERAARKLMTDVTARLNDVPGLRAFNEAQIALFERHAGETGFEILNGVPVMISQDDRHRLPMTLITEYPDETVEGDAFRAGHEAQMATALAAYDALQDLSLDLFPSPLVA